MSDVVFLFDPLVTLLYTRLSRGSHLPRRADLRTITIKREKVKSLMDTTREKKTTVWILRWNIKTKTDIFLLLRTLRKPVDVLGGSLPQTRFCENHYPRGIVFARESVSRVYYTRVKTTYIRFARMKSTVRTSLVVPVRRDGPRASTLYRTGDNNVSVASARTVA